jgi:hypothetical protein
MRTEDYVFYVKNIEILKEKDMDYCKIPKSLMLRYLIDALFHKDADENIFKKSYKLPEDETLDGILTGAITSWKTTDITNEILVWSEVLKHNLRLFDEFVASFPGDNTISYDITDGSSSRILLENIAYSLAFMSKIDNTLATMMLQSISRKMRDSRLSPEFMNKLLGGINPEKGLTRESIISHAKKTASENSELRSRIK